MCLMVEDVSSSICKLYGVILYSTSSNFCYAYLIVAQTLAGVHGVVLLRYVFSDYFLV